MNEIDIILKGIALLTGQTPAQLIEKTRAYYSYEDEPTKSDLLRFCYAAYADKVSESESSVGITLEDKAILTYHFWYKIFEIDREQNERSEKNENIK